MKKWIAVLCLLLTSSVFCKTSIAAPAVTATEMCLEKVPPGGDVIDWFIPDDAMFFSESDLKRKLIEIYEKEGLSIGISDIKIERYLRSKLGMDYLYYREWEIAGNVSAGDNSIQFKSSLASFHLNASLLKKKASLRLQGEFHYKYNRLGKITKKSLVCFLMKEKDLNPRLSILDFDGNEFVYITNSTTGRTIIDNIAVNWWSWLQGFEKTFELPLE